MFKESAISNVVILAIPFIVAFYVIFGVNLKIWGFRYSTTFAYTMFAFYGVGFLLFFVAKIATIRGGQLITFGPSRMSKRNRIFYKLGYALMLIGLFFTPFLLMRGIP